MCRSLILIWDFGGTLIKHVQYYLKHAISGSSLLEQFIRTLLWKNQQIDMIIFRVADSTYALSGKVLVATLKLSLWLLNE